MIKMSIVVSRALIGMEPWNLAAASGHFSTIISPSAHGKPLPTHRIAKDFVTGTPDPSASTRYARPFRDVRPPRILHAATPEGVKTCSAAAAAAAAPRTELIGG